MSQRNFLLLFAALGVICAVYLFNKKEMPAEIPTEIPTSAEGGEIRGGQINPSQPIISPSLKNNESTVAVQIKPPVPTPENKKNFNEALQQLKMVPLGKAREEVQANPHGTPPSVIANALEIGTVFDKISSESEARAFMDKMENCTGSNTETVTSIQATCIGYARRVTQRYPSLKSRFESLKEQSSAEAQKIEEIVRPKQ